MVTVMRTSRNPEVVTVDDAINVCFCLSEEVRLRSIQCFMEKVINLYFWGVVRYNIDDIRLYWVFDKGVIGLVVTIDMCSMTL